MSMTSYHQRHIRPSHLLLLVSFPLLALQRRGWAHILCWHDDHVETCTIPRLSHILLYPSRARCGSNAESMDPYQVDYSTSQKSALSNATNRIYPKCQCHKTTKVGVRAHVHIPNFFLRYLAAIWSMKPGMHVPGLAASYKNRLKSEICHTVFSQ